MRLADGTEIFYLFEYGGSAVEFVSDPPRN